MSQPSSIYRRLTCLPAGPVCAVISAWPSISLACAATSSMDLASRTPPFASLGNSLNLPLPRPPAWIWDFTTYTGPGRAFAAATASLSVSAGCACRKSNPDILVVQPAENWAAKNLPSPFDGARERRILLQGRDACARHCNISCMTAAGDGGGTRRARQRGQGIPVGSNRSAVRHIRFAMGNAATSADHECPLIESVG